MRAVAAVAVLIAATGCRRGGGSRADAGPLLVGPENFAVARRELIEVGPRISGSLEARQDAAILAEVGGPVVAVVAEVGQPVKKGALLARIRSVELADTARSARTQVRASESEAAVARRQVRRTQRLVESGALPLRDLDNARQALDLAEAHVADARARLAQAERQLSAATVTSPIDGVVARRAISPGDVVAVGALLYRIVDPSTMRLDAQVAAEQLAALTVGAPVEFQVRGYPDRRFTGWIESVSPAADPITRQIPFLVAIPNPRRELVAGLFAEGRVAAIRREALVVPMTALEEAAGAASVTRVRNGRAERVAVELGLRDEQRELAEIRSGLAAGDAVLVGDARTVAPGTPLDLVAGDGGLPRSQEALQPETAP